MAAVLSSNSYIHLPRTKPEITRAVCVPGGVTKFSLSIILSFSSFAARTNQNKRTMNGALRNITKENQCFCFLIDMFRITVSSDVLLFVMCENDQPAIITIQ